METEVIQVTSGSENIALKYIDNVKKRANKTKIPGKEPNNLYKIDSENPAVKELIDNNIEDINKVISSFNTKITFTKDKATGKTIIKIIDRNTDKTIKMIPPEIFLKLAAKIAELIGILVDEKI